MDGLSKAKALYERFGQGDVEGVLALFSPEIEFREAEGNPYQPDGEPFRGPDEILQRLFMRIGEEWDPFVITPESFLTSGDDSVIMEGRYRGTFKATGRELDAQVCHILRYANGKLSHFQQYVDTAQLRRVMGVD